MKHKILPYLFFAGTIPAIPATAKSLWANTAPARSAYSDRLASQPGDLLTVVISETTSLSGTQRSSRERSSSIASEVKAFLFSPTASKFGTHNGELPQTDISSSASSEGGGTVTNSTTLRSQATVRVIDVLPNGILVVEGTRAVAFSGQKYFGKLRGFVRPADISRANTIPSSAIADAHIEYVSEGSLTQNEKPGFLSRWFTKLNPF